jgi:hypothetical protein
MCATLRVLRCAEQEATQRRVPFHEWHTWIRFRLRNIAVRHCRHTRVHAQDAAAHPVPVQMWHGRAQSRSRCGTGEPVPEQMWQDPRTTELCIRPCSCALRVSPSDGLSRARAVGLVRRCDIRADQYVSVRFGALRRVFGAGAALPAAAAARRANRKGGERSALVADHP